MSAKKEISHYVVTAHPPGGVLLTAKCNFLSPTSTDVLVAKSRRLEVRQLRSASEEGSALPSPFPVTLQVPINGRLTSLVPLKLPNSPTSLVFMTTERFQYAVISHNPSAPSPYPITTHASGSLKGEEHSILGREAESGPLIAADHYSRCIALHLYDGLITIIPIDTEYRPPEPTKAGDEPSAPASRAPKVLGQPFHCRIEERTVLAITFLQTSAEVMPQICVLYQDSRGAQHITSHVINVKKKQLHLYASQSAPGNTEWLKKSSVDGGSSLLIPIPPRLASSAATANPEPNLPKSNTTGGVVIVGQRQFTYCSTAVTKTVPVPQALFLTYEELPADPNGMPRYLLGDEFGNLHMLTLMMVNDKVTSLQLDTLGSCTLSTALAYLEEGLVYVGSSLGDSQLVQIHDEPIQLEDDEEDTDLMDTTYLSVVEEYTHLGPILDFDLVPTAPGSNADSQMAQSQVVTASGSSKSGSIRLIRNGIGMNEYASVEIPGIQDMWSLRKSFSDKDDAYLVQSFVGETRVLGVASLPAEAMQEDEEEEAAGTLEEVFLPGLESSATTLFVGNIQPGDRLVQITETDVRLVSMEGQALDSWSGPITVASANEAGQIVVAVSGGMVIYFCVQDDKLAKLDEKQMDREVSCLDLHPFSPSGLDTSNAMEINNVEESRTAHRSMMVAVGLWDDFTVRLISLKSSLDELLKIDLSTEEEEEAEESNVASPTRRNRNNMMARSLCLITLDFSSSTAGHGGSSSSPGVNMLFVGLGDGTLISFAVMLRGDRVSVQSKKEVCLGTQRIDLIPLTTELGGTCVLATGDRPTVIYLAGVGGTSSNQFNPKLCYSNVNLSASEDDEGDDVSRPPSQQSIAVNVAAPFFSPLLFDATALGNQQYSLCVADDSNLRLGVIDDIQKLHVTTCRLGMAPRRIVHCTDGRLFAVGCIESGIKHFSLGGDEANMGNCIRFMDDTTFDDIERVDLEPYEMILSMAYLSLKMPSSADSAEATVTADGENSNAPVYKPFLLVGTAYALPDEDEPTRGRILIYSCQADEGAAGGNNRAVRQVTEFSAQGGVYSMCQFYDGKMLCTVNTKTNLCQLVNETGVLKLQFVGIGHHGHILSLFVKSRAKTVSSEPSRSVGEEAISMDISDHQKTVDGEKKATEPEEELAIVGDLMRSISLVQYYPQHQTLEEVARDFNSNWTTAVEMLTEDVYLGSQNWNNFFCLRRNKAATSEEVRCRLDTIGEFHLGEMCNKFMCGSLVMPVSTNKNIKSSHRAAVRRGATPQKKKAESPSKASAASRIRRPVVVTGSQTLFGTVDGTLGVVLGLDGRTAAFFATLERAMATVINPVGDFSHQMYRACQSERRIHPAHGFVDGDLVESFLDLDRGTMEAVVNDMNRDGGWEVDDAIAVRSDETGDSGDGATDVVEDGPELSVDDVLAMVEEMTMLH